MSPFDTDERSDLARAMDSLDVVGGECQLEVVRVAGDQPANQVDLLEGDLGGFAAADRFDRRVRRPEFAPTPPARSRARSVSSVGCGCAISSLSKPESPLVRNCQGRSLWPSINSALRCSSRPRPTHDRGPGGIAGTRWGFVASSWAGRPQQDTDGQQAYRTACAFHC